MSSKQKSIIILTPGFPASESDSNCLPMLQHFTLTLQQQQPGYRVMVLSFQYPYFVDSYTWSGITVMSFNGQNKGGLYRQLLRFKLNKVLQQIKQEHNIAGIISFWYGECAWVGKRFADKYNLKHVCWILGQDAKKGNKYIKQIGLKAYELAALSHFIRDEFEKNYGIRPAFVIPPGIDGKQFGPATEQKNIHLLAAGSLIPLKQFDIFIELVAGIKKYIPGIKAMLIGDGPERKELQRLIIEQELEANIELTGELPHGIVLQSMQSAKIFIHPSDYEGFGVVCIEALYAGCRVISFCKPMEQEIENWQIAHNKEDMIQKALSILQDKHTDFKTVLPFSMADTADKMMSLFTG